MGQDSNVLKFPIAEIAPPGREARRLTAKALMKALELKDSYTYQHSLRVAYFGLVLGSQLGLSGEEMEELELSCLFHDIGKIGIPEKVLLKPERLDEDEFLVMKQHPEKSGDLLETLPGFGHLAQMAKHHHERYDGRGYPSRLKGEEIPLFARVILIADTYDAMTSSRPYRQGLEPSLAYAELREFSGSQFDPNLVELFIQGMILEEHSNENMFYLSTLNERFDKKAA